MKGKLFIDPAKIRTMIPSWSSKIMDSWTTKASFRNGYAVDQVS
jgi:hypothetical protein